MAKSMGAFWVAVAALAVLLMMRPAVVAGDEGGHVAVADVAVANELSVEDIDDVKDGGLSAVVGPSVAAAAPSVLSPPVKFEGVASFLAPVLIYNFHESVLDVNIYPQLASNIVFRADKQIEAFDDQGMASFNPGTRFVVNAVFNVNSGDNGDFLMDSAALHTMQEEMDIRELTTGYIAVALPGSINNKTDVVAAADAKTALRGAVKLPVPLEPLDDIQPYENKNYHQLAKKMMARDDIKPDEGTGFFGVVFQAASESLYRIHGYLNAGNVAFTWRYFKSDRCPRLFVGKGSEWGECAEVAFCSILTLRKGYEDCFSVPEAKLSFTSRK